MKPSRPSRNPARNTYVRTNAHSARATASTRPADLPASPQLLRRQRRIAIHLADQIVEVHERLVHDRLPQRAERPVDDHALVHAVVGKAGAAAAEEAHHVIGPPARVTHEASAEARSARQPIRRGRRSSQPIAALISVRRRGCQPLVGVEREHPVAGREIERAILLRAEAGPVRRHDDLRASLARDLDGAVRAPRVDDDDLVGPRDRVEGARDARLPRPWRSR